MSPDVGECGGTAARKARTGTARWRVRSVQSVLVEVGENTTGQLRHVIESHLRIHIRVFLLPEDVVCMRTTAVKWNIASRALR